MPVYLQIAGITGEAKETNHSGWTVATGLSSPVDRKIPSGAYGQEAINKGALSFGNMHITREVDSSSVALAKQTALGKVYDSLEIHVTTAIGGGGEQVKLEYKLEKACLVSHGLNVATVEKTQDLGEHMEINFSKITWTYRKYNASGSADGVVTGWYDRELAIGG